MPGTRRARAVTIAAGLAGMVAAGSCARAERDPAQALVDELAEAAEDRDAGRIVERLADDFSGPGGLTRADAAASLRRYFAGYETIDVEVYDVEARPADGMTTVRTRIGFKGEANRAFGLEGLLPPSAVYRFDLDVGERDGVWRVVRAAWERVTPPGGDRGP